MRRTNGQAYTYTRETGFFIEGAFLGARYHVFFFSRAGSGFGLILDRSILDGITAELGWVYCIDMAL